MSILLCSAIAVAQTDQAPTIQVNSRIVYVDVVVRDGAGRVVHGLAEKDFRLLENGKPQTITYFSDHTHDRTRNLNLQRASWNFPTLHRCRIPSISSFSIS